MKIKFTKETIELFKQLGTVVYVGDTYLYMPYWFKETENKDVFEVTPTGKLPKDLEKFIKGLRSEKPGSLGHANKIYPQTPDDSFYPNKEN